MNVDEDLLRYFIIHSQGIKHDGPLFDIRLLGNSIMFRLNPNSGAYGVDYNYYKSLLRDKKLKDLGL